MRPSSPGKPRRINKFRVLNLGWASLTPLGCPCSGKYNTAGPGGATAINVNNQYVNMAFHSDINGKDASGGRAMWTISSVCLGGGIAKPC